MPIVYVHGVSVRDEKGWEHLELLLRRYIAPTISDDPAGVSITRCYWGEFGARFRFGGVSIPNSPLRIMLKDRSISKFTMAQLGKLKETSQQAVNKVKMKTSGRHHSDLSPKQDALVAIDEDGLSEADASLDDFKLASLSPENLSNLLAQAVVSSGELDSEGTVIATLAADEIAHEDSTFAALQKCKNAQEEAKLMKELVVARYEKLIGTISLNRKKLPVLKEGILVNLLESVARTVHGAGFAVTRAAAEVKNPLNQFVTMFIGDVFAYLMERGDCRAPGWIPSTFIAALSEAQQNKIERGGEPLIVMSHSMGGQIVYDMVTHFLPKMDECKDIRVDFWCATASQVGLFEELKLFIESKEDFGLSTGQSVPYPDSAHLGYWWNVWDHNDFVSYSASSIIEKVDDEPYSTGMALVSAHGGYLQLPSFFRRFAKKLKTAKNRGWNI